MRPALIILSAAIALACPAAARAQDVTLGIAAPLSDTAAVLGRQMREGARVAANQAGDDVFIDVADDRCSAQGGAAVARGFAQDEADAVVGFLCTEALEAALPILRDAGIPVITPGVRTASVTDTRDKTGWLVYRTAPRADAEEKAVATILVERWRDDLFAIVDDGTIYGRGLAENLRAAAEAAELKPVFMDTFRPQMDNQIGLLGRLRNAGATHVFVGGDRADIAVMARDAKELGYDLTIAGGEALRADSEGVPLAAGVLMVGLPRWEDVASRGALDGLAEAGIVAEGYVLPGYAATEVAIQAARAALEAGGSVTKALDGGTFETALGALAFDAKGDLTENPYRLFRYDGEKFVEAE